MTNRLRVRKIYAVEMLRKATGEPLLAKDFEEVAAEFVRRLLQDHGLPARLLVSTWREIKANRESHKLWLSQKADRKRAVDHILTECQK